jgi:hypothetical protein
MISISIPIFCALIIYLFGGYIDSMKGEKNV